MTLSKTQHEIVAELKRVAIELGRAPTLKELFENSSITEMKLRSSRWSYAFALIACGLKEPKKSHEEKRVEKNFNLQIQKRDGVIELGLKFDKELLPWVGKYERDPTKTTTIMIRSDDHAQWMDPFCDAVFWDVAKRIQPSIINFAGDNVDFWAISAHSKNPRRTLTMQSEIDYTVVHMFDKAREVCPNAQIDWLLGNHEWRLFRYLSDNASALSSLRCLQFNDLFRLDKNEINLIARPSFLNARTGKDIENYKIYNGVFTSTHGTRLGVFPAKSEFEVFGTSGVSGHVHRHTAYHKNNLHGQHVWTTNGAMCLLKSGEEYIPDLVNWNNGFTIAHIEGKSVFTEYVNCTPELVCVGGVYYRRKNYEKPS